MSLLRLFVVPSLYRKVLTHGAGLGSVSCFQEDIDLSSDEVKFRGLTRYPIITVYGTYS